MKHDFSLKTPSVFCGNFCFLGLKKEISENQDLFICLYCLRDSWGLYFCCFICFSGLCTAGKNALPQWITMRHCYGSPSHGDHNEDSESLSRQHVVFVLYTCGWVYRAPWQCFGNHQPPLSLIFYFYFLQVRVLVWFLVGFILADSLVGTTTQCCLSFLGSRFPFLPLCCFPHWLRLSLACILADNYGSVTCSVWNYHFHYIRWVVAANGISTWVTKSHFL